MIVSIALAVIATAVAAAAVLLLVLFIDFLVRRPDVTAGLLMGSTLVDAIFANRSPSEANAPIEPTLNMWSGIQLVDGRGGRRVEAAFVS